MFDSTYTDEHCETPEERTALRKAKKRVPAVRQRGGDDGYAYALVVDGQVRISGMMRGEANSRRNRALRNIVAGKQWNSID